MVCCYCKTGTTPQVRQSPFAPSSTCQSLLSVFCLAPETSGTGIQKKKYWPHLLKEWANICCQISHNDKHVCMGTDSKTASFYLTLWESSLIIMRALKLNKLNSRPFLTTSVDKSRTLSDITSKCLRPRNPYWLSDKDTYFPLQSHCSPITFPAHGPSKHTPITRDNSTELGRTLGCITLATTIGRSWYIPPVYKNTSKHMFSNGAARPLRVESKRHWTRNNCGSDWRAECRIWSSWERR